MRNVFFWCVLLGGLLSVGCADRSGDASRWTNQNWLGAVTLVDAPAAPGARFPHLAGGNDGTPVVISWLEPGGAGDFSLRHARWNGENWGAPNTVANGTDWFINWADFPSVVPLTRSLWAAHWLQRRPGNVYSYDVRLSTSADSGTTWSAPVTPHDDDTPTEHGFVSIVGFSGFVSAVWLDGRNTAGESHEHEEHDSAGGAMSLRGGALGRDGSIVGGHQIDGRVCDCCQTDAVRVGHDVLVVYRDRSEDETRDIYLARLRDGQWNVPLPVHNDGWRIDGCPVNGPAIDASGNHVAVAWFTAPDQPRVRLAFSDDAGNSFSAPIEVANGKIIGRVDVALLNERRAVVSWLEQVPGGAQLRVQPFTAQGAAGPARSVTNSAIERSSGFPQMIFDGQRLLFAWTQTGAPAGIRTAAATLD